MARSLVMNVIIALLVLAAAAERASYIGERVVRVHLNSTAEYEKLNAFAETYFLDVWASNAIRQTVDVRVPFHIMPMLEQLHMPFETYIEDVQAVVDTENVRLAQRKANADFFDEYRTYEEIVDWLNQLASTYSNIVTRINIGTTYGGRQIPGVRVAGRSARKGFFFNGGQHAREWITVPTVLGILDTLVKGYGNDTEITNFLDNIEFTVVAPLNPDGYSFTWTDDRLWRKNREPNSGSICVGTDTNRNFQYGWATGGSSALPCSDTYHGPRALSSREASAVDAYLKSRNSAGIKYHGYIDFHSYSQLFMSPYGASSALPPDYSKHMAVLNDISTAISSSGYNTRYQVGPVYSTIYQASGGSNDHTYSINGVLYSLAAEGRDNGRYGFLLPTDQIRPSIIENLNAVKVVARAILAI